MRLYGQIQKIEPLDDGTVRVEGVVSSEAVDDQGEIVRCEAMRAAIPDYMKFPAIREMHGLSAAGTALELVCDNDGMTRTVAHIIDPIAVKKVKNKVYRGFSIGGRVLEREAGSSNVITRLQLNEISLVDRPANPEAIYDVWKASRATGERQMDGSLGTLGDVLAAQIAAQKPVQKWDCEVPEHKHVKKEDAQKCMAKHAATAMANDGVAAIISAAADAIAKGEAVVGDNEIMKADAKDEEDAKDEADAKDEEDAKDEADAKDEEDAKDKPPWLKVTKGLWDVGEVAETIMCLSRLKESLELERASEGDDSTLPSDMEAIIGQLCTFMRSLVAEGTQEIMAGTEADERDLPSTDGMFAMALVLSNNDLSKRTVEEINAVTYLDNEIAKATRSARDQSMLNLAYHAALAGSEVRGLAKATVNHFANAAESLKKAGAMPLPADDDQEAAMNTGDNFEHSAPNSTSPSTEFVSGRNSTVNTAKTEAWVMSLIEHALGKAGGHQHFADVAHDVVGKLTDGMACEATKVGARFSAETMRHLRDAHEHLTKAGAICKNMMDEPTTPTQDEHQGTSTDAGEDKGEPGDKAGGNYHVTVTAVDDLRKITDERDQLMAVVGPLTATVEKLAARVEQIANQPMPALTAGRGAAQLMREHGLVEVSKADDGRLINHEQLQKEGPQLTPQMVAEVIAKMTPEDKTLLAIKGALSRPFVQP